MKTDQESPSLNENNMSEVQHKKNNQYLIHLSENAFPYIVCIFQQQHQIIVSFNYINVLP